MREITEKSTKKQILEAYIELKGNKESITQKVSVVIPFVAEFSQGNELQLALRGWLRNFQEKFNIVIIGDRAPWMSENLPVIECARIDDNPPVDIANKMMLAINSSLVSDKFIWANDDQYVVSPCMLSDFETLKTIGQLDEIPIGTNLYSRNKKRTIDLLREIGGSMWDYSSHTPFVFEKEKLKSLIEKYNLTEEPYLIATLYYNVYFPQFIPYMLESRAALLYDNFKVGVYRQDADFELMKKLLPGKKIVNNSQRGWTPRLEEILNNLFAEKCQFEK